MTLRWNPTSGHLESSSWLKSVAFQKPPSWHFWQSLPSVPLCSLSGWHAGPHWFDTFQMLSAVGVGLGWHLMHGTAMWPPSSGKVDFGPWNFDSADSFDVRVPGILWQF